ncbi:hypothetical protein F511_26872 [Dorcoceras hygrometricum]|uniref:Uncharacterized protein n=1 Tax=Dorcoceras hygrometricum TaxID=472368 RepID=A0A2Z7D895_9LAMI|nr:hypothetical protein F511_26872 [Dorcoceras hygrometricum]
MLSIQTGYTSTVSKVANDPSTGHEFIPNDFVSRFLFISQNDVALISQLEPNFTYSPRRVRVYYQNDDVAPTSSKPVDTSINQQIHKSADASYSDPVASTSRPTTGVPAASISSPATQPVARTSRPPADVPVASYSDPDASYSESEVARRN